MSAIDQQRRRLLKAGAIAALWGPGAFALPDVPAGGPNSFRKGVNLSEWLQLSQQAPVSISNLARLKLLGFGHVRLPVNPLTIGWQGSIGNGGAFSALPRLDQAIERILAAGLNLILDFHADEDSLAVLTSSSGEAAWLDAWDCWARRYAATPPARLAFELMNEPHRVYKEDRKAWLRAQNAAISRIRRWTDAHWIMTSGLWEPFDTLRALDPPADSRLIASVQFYRPYELTHMGANWGDAEKTGIRDIRALRYPATLTDAHASHTAHGGNDQKTSALTRDYLNQDWQPDKLKPYIEDAAQWSKAHRIPVHFAEFGVLRRYADPESRYRWLHDVRSLIEGFGMGWTVWELSCLFGITELGDAKGAVQTQDCVAYPQPLNIEAGVRASLGLSEN